MSSNKMGSKQKLNQPIDEQIRVVVSSLEPEKGAIRVNIAEPPAPPPGVKLKIREPIKVYLKIRSTLGGDYMIFDHPLYDIAIMPGKNKIVTFVRKNSKIDAYSSQDDFFEFLRQKGMIIPDSIQGGNVYGSLEGQYPPSSDGRDHGQVAIFTIGKFIEEEKPYYTAKDNLDDTMEDWWLDASEEDTTNLGEIPQAQVKGSIPKGMERMHGYRVYESKE